MRPSITAVVGGAAALALAAVPSVAFAETPDRYLETGHEFVECGVVDVTLRNVSPWLYRVLIEIEESDGTWVRVAQDPDAASDPVMYPSTGVITVDNRNTGNAEMSGTYTVVLPENTGARDIRYRVSSGTESDLYLNLPVGSFTYVEDISTDCSAPLTITEFAAPVKTGVNKAKAGSTVPLKFQVFEGDSEVTDVAAIDSISLVRIVDGVEEPVDITTTGPGLRYADGTFIQNWKTPKAPGLYEVTATTVDGTQVTATFQLR